MRRLASTWFAKGLFLLLVLSFGIWGIEDTIRGLGQDTAVARVAGRPIELVDAQVAAQRAITRTQRQLAGRVEMDADMRAAVARQALEAMIADRARSAEAERMGLAVPAATIRDFIWAVPAFQGGDGRFSRLILDQFLRQNELSEPEFLRLVSDDLQRIQLIGGVRAGATAPTELTSLLYGFANEQRIADVVEFAYLSAPEPEPPTEAALRRFHENNPENFSAPEYRTAVVAALSPATLAGEIQIDDRAIEEAYASRRLQYETPERRDLEQALLPTEDAAAAVATSWRAGADMATITAEARAAGGNALALGDVDRAALPLPELAEAAFAPAQGGVSNPVRSPFGWHVFRIVAVTPGTTRSLADVRGELAASLATERAADVAYERANRVEDALAGGATLAEVAPRFGLGLTEVRTDSRGLDAEGRPVPLPVTADARAATLTAIFAAEQGRGPRMEEIGGGTFVAIDLREITPAALKPFEMVEADVRRLWLLDARRRHQEEAAAGLLRSVQSGTPIAQAAAAVGLSVDRMGPFGRRPPAADAPPPAASQPPSELRGPVFSLAPGGATMVATRDGYVVAVLVEVVAGNPAADPIGLATIKSETEQAIAADLEAQFTAALRDRANVRLNNSLLPALTAR
ncbi:peptidyl-prolyl cis-trans isomerase [Humitalea sp. 24SJ18S-53]|uniref:peptidylprolyl isomerase n=1 Tax=Humitalea sp. 24SJ18S-53 TaxID=3422307 RepID=UPI003D66E11F